MQAFFMIHYMALFGIGLSQLILSLSMKIRPKSVEYQNTLFISFR